MPTSSEPSAQSKSPSHQNLEGTQSPLAQRKSFNVHVCGSRDRKTAQGYPIFCSHILNMCNIQNVYDTHQEMALRKKEVSQAEPIHCSGKIFHEAPMAHNIMIF